MMTVQTGTSQRWNDTSVLFCSPPCEYKQRRGTLFLNLNRPVTADDVPDLKEIAMGVLGFADVECSDIPNIIILVFTDYKVTNARMHELKEWLLHHARNHECTPDYHHEQISPEQLSTIERAIAVHSTVNRFDDYDR